MRLANLRGRLTLVTPGGVVDVATASDGRFGPDPQAIFDDWTPFRRWADDLGLRVGDPGEVAPSSNGHLDPKALGPVVPRPRQIFAVGLNYVDHSAESGFTQPAQPMIFTKFASCLTGPTGPITLSSDTVDWEVELVVVIGVTASRVTVDRAWDHVAGLTVGQDLSDRALQMRGVPPQFSLAKSFAGYGPIGPVLTTPDEVTDRDDLELSCLINGEVVQHGRSRDMVFPVPVLISYLSAVCPLYPGDLIFTGTPPGVGFGRSPARYLSPGDVLRTRISQLGELRHECVAATDSTDPATTLPGGRKPT
ncbi:fumarylacetoacetate hydrolase family protein [Solwaraspora sp. WMMD406]|uniref:fumarylacetoacetate hydrolase family protein n=1 Tax=Solwaraspora sp. WMMD406 TaxID=3016095 RepID=UPI002415A34B|nr:fumarylacetoacetate hydrolase family protein [Solwaraspora sp. WMMD406]MDG4766405.1 fumarylacetoacetate hydrolase family protein [Solwaraspora sp. WMMD406]